ncbi:longitudinals lacking protein-like [Schistocerca piceifrons]|uniref:longitudinals lacking protein-like n=1 Tax=Schistocerca piceifrons TaxID=274613 RepID=UPI001F5F17ED|nr:longitudinals lacking protein-like [Schistocerca piceifrons]
MGSEHYCLRWNNHQSNLLGVFSQLLQDESLVDVTLACAEGHSIRAHKVVLSACSSYFQTLFVDHPSRHPIVILKDVRFAELRTLVEFMYKGEVNVEYCQLSALLKTAESLKVKGLAEMTNLNSGRDEHSEVPNAKHSSNASGADVPPSSDSAAKRLSDGGARTPLPAESVSPPVRVERQQFGDKDNSGCDENESCDEGARRADTPEVDDLSIRGNCAGPSDMTVGSSAVSSHPPTAAAVTATSSTAVCRLPSPHSSEPIPGPSCMLPVQQVPLSLKKEVDWDRSVADDKSTTGESSSDYRHPQDLDLSPLDARYGSPCVITGSRQLGSDIQISNHTRSSTPFQFPFSPFAAGFPSSFGAGFPDMGIDALSRQNCSILNLLHQQSLLASPVSEDGGRSPFGTVGSGIFRCSVCLASFPSSWLLEQHSDLQHSVPSQAEDTESEEKPFKCDQCGQSYRYRSAYLKHREQNHRARLPADKLFTCDVCGMQFRYLKSFKKHRLNHALEKLHSKSPSEFDIFTRTIRNNGMLGDLLGERALRNSSVPESATDYSGKIFPFMHKGSESNSDSTLNTTVTSSDKDMEKSAATPTATVPTPESSSEQVSSSNEAVVRNMSEEKPVLNPSYERIPSGSLSKLGGQNLYRFPLSDYYYGSSASTTEGSSVEEKKVFKTEKTSEAEQDETIDSMTFALSMTSSGSNTFRSAHEASLINLLRMDAAERQRERRFACPFCGKCVRSKENLKLHVRKHTGERPFVCLFCGRAFGGKSDLTRHLRIHTGERPYHCEMCGKCFARADYLSKHLTTHIHNSQR